MNRQFYEQKNSGNLHKQYINETLHGPKNEILYHWWYNSLPQSKRTIIIRLKLIDEPQMNVQCVVKRKMYTIDTSICVPVCIACIKATPNIVNSTSKCGTATEWPHRWVNASGQTLHSVSFMLFQWQWQRKSAININYT